MLQTSLLEVPSPRRAAIAAIHEHTAIYTSVSVVDQMLDRSGWPGAGGKLLDPSAGDGAFLIRALDRLRPAPGNFAAALRVRGYEFHGDAVQDARWRVAATLRGMGWGPTAATSAAEQIVEERDFLIDGPGNGRFRWIVGNPPYLRFARLPEIYKALYADIVAKHALGDLLHAFLDRCCEILTDDGAALLVTADRWLYLEGCKDLREAIGRRVGLSHVTRLDPSTSFYRAKTRRAGTLPRVHPVEVAFRPAALALVPITAAPISPDGFDLAPHQGPTMADVADVRIAPWLGPAGIFVVNHETAAQLRGADLVPAIDTDDIDPHSDALRQPTRYAIRTAAAEEPTGALQAHLMAQRHRMPPRGQRGPYWVPPETINLRLDRPMLLIPRIARRLRAIPLPPGLLPVNHNLSVVNSRSDVTLEELRQILTSEESQAWILRNAAPLEKAF